MTTNTITLEQQNAILLKLEELKTTIDNSIKQPKDAILDNQEFIQLLHISKRTAQSWRDEGKISFSQIGSKIYYKMADVQKLLDTNYRKAFKVKSKF